MRVRVELGLLEQGDRLFRYNAVPSLLYLFVFPTTEGERPVKSVTSGKSHVLKWVRDMVGTLPSLGYKRSIYTFGSRVLQDARQVKLL